MVMWEESRGGETLACWGYGVERVWGTTVRTGAGESTGQDAALWEKNEHARAGRVGEDRGLCPGCRIFIIPRKG